MYCEKGKEGATLLKPITSLDFKIGFKRFYTTFYYCFGTSNVGCKLIQGVKQII